MQWDPKQYLHFARERTQPSRDLAMRIEVDSPRSVLDLGCGPGNSTAVLAERFPGARVVGGDNSDQMLQMARADHPDLEFIHLDAMGDLTTWAGAFDVVFSNACLHWVPDHRALIPRLMGMLAPGGQLAVQVPLLGDLVMYRDVIYPLAASDRWNEKLADVDGAKLLDPDEYPTVLASCSAEYEIWETIYWHRMPSHDAVIAWYQGSGLRPYLQRLNESDQEALLEEVRERVSTCFPRNPNGEVSLKFPRLFWIATKG